MYEAVQKKLESFIDSYGGKLTIVTDCWSNPRNESMQNYLLTMTYGGTVLWKAEQLTARNTAQHIANGIMNVLQGVGVHKIVAVCTDNASNMRAAWEIMKAYIQALSTWAATHTDLIA